MPVQPGPSSICCPVKPAIQVTSDHSYLEFRALISEQSDRITHIICKLCTELVTTSIDSYYVYSLVSIQIKNFLTQYYSLSSESGRQNTLNSETNVTIGISIYTKEYWLTTGPFCPDKHDCRGKMEALTANT